MSTVMSTMYILLKKLKWSNKYRAQRKLLILLLSLLMNKSLSDPHEQTPSTIPEPDSHILWEGMLLLQRKDKIHLLHNKNQSDNFDSIKIIY